MLKPVRATVPFVVQQHVEDIESLRSTRSVLVRASHMTLRLLRRHDDRIAAHHEGVAAAGSAAAPPAALLLERPGRGALFVSTLIALGNRDSTSLDRLLAVAEAMPSTYSGVVSAFGWVSAGSLRGVTKALLDSPSAFRRGVGLAACVMHHVNPGATLQTALGGEGAAQALRLAGRLGRLDLLPHCVDALAHEDADCQLEAARSALLLGNRNEAVHKLVALASAPSAQQQPALLLVLKVLGVPQVQALLKPMVQDASALRLLIRGIGASGDTSFVPWLIRQMDNPKTARLAGEAFSTITGADLVQLKLYRSRPAPAEPDPLDDPEAAEAALDEDSELPWPDAGRVATFWRTDSPRFMPGQRYFVGAQPTPAHCVSVLKTGFQRQRMAAAQYLCLMQTGTPLFNVCAPAWRQEKLLIQMHASPP